MSALEARLRDLYEQRKSLYIRLNDIENQISEDERLISEVKNGVREYRAWDSTPSDYPDSPADLAEHHRIKAMM